MAKIKIENNSPNFNYGEFDTIRNQSGLNCFHKKT